MSIECLSAGARVWACELLSDCASSCMSVGFFWMIMWVYVWRQSLSAAYFIPSPNWFRLSAIKSSRPLCLILSAPWTVLRWNSFNQHFVFPSAATFISRSWLLVVLFLPSHQLLFPSYSFSSHLFFTSLSSFLLFFLFPLSVFPFLLTDLYEYNQNIFIFRVSLTVNVTCTVAPELRTPH